MDNDMFVVQEPDTRTVVQEPAGQDYVFLDTGEVFIIGLETV